MNDSYAISSGDFNGAGCMINGFEPVTLKQLILNNNTFYQNQKLAIEKELIGTYTPTYIQKKRC